MTELNPGERRFADYLDEHGYAWMYEPDYQAELALDSSRATKPDFLVEREGQRAVAEVRQFEAACSRTSSQEWVAAALWHPKRSLASSGLRCGRKPSSCDLWLA